MAMKCTALNSQPCCGAKPPFPAATFNSCFRAWAGNLALVRGAVVCPNCTEPIKAFRLTYVLDRLMTHDFYVVDAMYAGDV